MSEPSQQFSIGYESRIRVFRKGTPIRSSGGGLFNRHTILIFVGAVLSSLLLEDANAFSRDMQKPYWKPVVHAIQAGPIPRDRPESLIRSLPKYHGLRVLSPKDAERYRKIFDLQSKGNWELADREITWLDDKVLVGHLQFQRYMHPRKYWSRYGELRDWLEDYGDHPGAKRVYRLAIKRKPSGVSPPAWSKRSTRVKGNSDIGWSKTRTKRSRRAIRQAAVDWNKGLLSWKGGDYEQALLRFSAVAHNGHASAWTASAASFWAARAALSSGNHKEVLPYMELASSYPLTFYGIIAARLLGRPHATGWAQKPVDWVVAERLKDIPAVRRAVALTEAGQPEIAGREFRTILPTVELALLDDLLAAAVELKLAPTAIFLSKLAPSPTSSRARRAAFPFPYWEPDGGFKLDRALIYAFIRQESEFRIRAKSRAGARGLMQLMPRTASYVARDRSLHGSKRYRLFDPEYNMSLGQKYLGQLIRDPDVDGDLMRLAIAYNGGPGNLRKWLRRLDHEDDSLLFIETLPSEETRNFVERVLANLWIYRMRLGQDIPSLDNVAIGVKPRYVALDRKGYKLLPAELTSDK